MLQEYKLKNKNNLFLDKRIGEKDGNLTAEDRMIARLKYLFKGKTNYKFPLLGLQQRESKEPARPPSSILAMTSV